MTTPKELADKAKQQIEVAKEAWTATERINAESALRATIDQLQAMAEARQGSGEPVATLRRRNYDGTQTYALNPLERPDGSSPWESLPVGDYPLYTSAQQATGLLTDEPDPADIIAGSLQTSRAHAYEIMRDAVREQDAYFAAATQAQPLATDAGVRGVDFGDDSYRRTSLQNETRGRPVMEDPLSGLAARSSGVEGSIVHDAAHTTGKREPLTREGCHYLCNAGSVCNKCGHVHGITGEQPQGKREPLTPDHPDLIPRGFLLQWPAVGGKRHPVWNDTDDAAKAIGCPSEPLFALRGITGKQQ